LVKIADIGVRSSQNLKLMSREIILKVFQPVWSTYVNVTDRQTDKRTT